MSKPDCSRAIRLAEAQGSIPGPAGEHAVVVFRRGPLDVALSLALRPSQQTPHDLKRAFRRLLARLLDESETSADFIGFS